MILILLLSICITLFAKSEYYLPGPYDGHISKEKLEYEFDLVLLWNSSSDYKFAFNIDDWTMTKKINYPINFRIGISKTENGNKYRFLQYSLLNTKLDIKPIKSRFITVYPSFVESEKYEASCKNSSIIIKYKSSLHDVDYLLYKMFFHFSSFPILIGGGLNMGCCGRSCDMCIKGNCLEIDLQKNTSYVSQDLPPGSYKKFGTKETSENIEKKDMYTIDLFASTYLFYAGPYITTRVSWRPKSFNIYLSYKGSPLINAAHSMHQCCEEGTPLLKEEEARKQALRRQEAYTEEYQNIKIEAQFRKLYAKGELTDLKRDEIIEKVRNTPRKIEITDDDKILLEFLRNNKIPDTFYQKLKCAVIDAKNHFGYFTHMHEVKCGINWSGTIQDSATISFGCSFDLLALCIPKQKIIYNYEKENYFVYKGFTISCGMSM